MVIPLKKCYLSTELTLYEGTKGVEISHEVFSDLSSSLSLVQISPLLCSQHRRSYQLVEEIRDNCHGIFFEISEVQLHEQHILYCVMAINVVNVKLKLTYVCDVSHVDILFIAVLVANHSLAFDFVAAVAGGDKETSHFRVFW